MSEVEPSLRGSVALVAGGYGGIGEACARALAAQGATTIVAGRNAEKAAAAARAFNGQVAASSVAFDARHVASIRAAVSEVASRHGRIDFLVNCVGTQQIEAMVDVTEEAFDRVLDVNLKAAMFLGQAVARVQIATQTGGRHVHLLSVRAMLGMRDRGYSSYCSSKGGLALLVRQHAVELARHGINVNGVAPTVVRTRMAADWDDPEVHRRLLERIPLGRIAEVEDVVGPVLFFLAPASAFVTGQILYVDGGITATQ
ncbi:MAG TPA: SDR family oxidoreductase [Casimicrobiaceae bacterium]|nr:SDR family oxidoreductase [Casimicrobiaceae bacterium]